AGCVFCVREDASTARLRLLLVEPWARGLGIGARLVDEVLRFARQAGYTRITLWTNDVLADARRIYQRAGFTLDDENQHHSFGQDLTGQNWSRALGRAATGHGWAGCAGSAWRGGAAGAAGSSSVRSKSRRTAPARKHSAPTKVPMLVTGTLSSWAVPGTT